MVGKTLGHYKIIEPLGAGGMGEVYRARDTKLDRDVAIKVLPEDFATDPDRLARFEREAKLLAQLNHANIAGIHGFEDADGVRFIVMEVVEGETLGERLAAAGRLDVEESLGIAGQIAEAFEAAHEAGIIHRDLKPANVKITPEGNVKVLDFGLAKAYEADGSASSISPELSASPTVAAATRTGVILGTAAYMSPEQARGNRADKRTDIWAFGALLYEMLTGSRPFQGETVSDTLASILKEEPDWNQYPVNSLGKVRDLLRKCMQKDPDQRLHDIADVRIEIGEILADPDALAGEEPSIAPQGAMPWVIGGVAGAALAIFALTVVAPQFQSPAEPSPPRFAVDIVLPEGQELLQDRRPGLALSPDGETLVYSATDGDGDRLYVRRLDDFETRPIAGSEGADTPFFSPEGDWLGFVARGTLWKIRLDLGGTPTPIIENADFIRGATWTPDGTIIMGTFDGGLRGVLADGGAPESITELDPDEGSYTHRLPHVLPDGESVLFIVYKGGANDDSDIALLSLETLQHRVVFEGGTFPRYAESGHLLFGREPHLFATALDLLSQETFGAMEIVVPDVNQSFIRGGMQYATSNAGALVYEPYAYPPLSELVLVDRAGTEAPLPVPPDAFGGPRFSPDARYIALSIDDPEARHIWTYDLDRDSLIQQTNEGRNISPVWSPDSSRFFFASNRLGGAGGFWEAYVKGLEQAEPERIIDGFSVIPSDWRETPEGQVVVFENQATGALNDLAYVTIDQPETWKIIANTSFSEQGARLSPDGLWIVFESTEAGPLSVFVAAFPDTSRRVPVSVGGGWAPVWSPDGDRIYYRNASHLMSVGFAGTLDEALPPPEQVLDVSSFVGTWDINPTDGDQFVFVRNVVESAPRVRLVLVTNWFEKLSERLPTGR